MRCLGLQTALFAFILTSLSEQSKHIILAATKISIQETDDREGTGNNVDLSVVNATSSHVHRDLLLPVDKLACRTTPNMPKPSRPFSF